MSRKHKFIDLTLEKAHEKIELECNKLLISIASKELQDSQFHQLRGRRFQCLDLMDLLVELDKVKDGD